MYLYYYDEHRATMRYRIHNDIIVTPKIYSKCHRQNRRIFMYLESERFMKLKSVLHVCHELTGLNTGSNTQGTMKSGIQHCSIWLRECALLQWFIVLVLCSVYKKHTHNWNSQTRIINEQFTFYLCACAL